MYGRESRMAKPLLTFQHSQLICAFLGRITFRIKGKDKFVNMEPTLVGSLLFLPWIHSDLIEKMVFLNFASRWFKQYTRSLLFGVNLWCVCIKVYKNCLHTGIREKVHITDESKHYRATPVTNVAGIDGAVSVTNNFPNVATIGISKPRLQNSPDTANTYVCQRIHTKTINWINA